MAEEDLNYFVCTLGQAAVWNEKHPHSFETINDLIDEQAEKVPDAPAVGFLAMRQRATYGPWNKGFRMFMILGPY